MILLTTFVFSQCEQATDKKVKPRKKRAWVKPASLNYHVEKPDTWLQKNATAAQKKIILAVNRTDSTFLKKMDSILVPDDLSGDLELYLPFPTSISYLSGIEKNIFFSYPSQTFGAYEYGELVYAGPTNMGRKEEPTPSRL